MRLSRACRLPTWLLFALAVTAVLSRVCVLPHAHADTKPTGYSRDCDDGEDAATDAIHRASREAVRSPQIQFPALAVVLAAMTLQLAPTPPAVASPRALFRGSSLPLYLLYAALLI